MKAQSTGNQQKRRCSLCKQRCTPYMTVFVDGVPKYHCQSCWLKQRAEFATSLAAGDPKATRIYNAVKLAYQLGMSKGEKKQ